MASDESRRIVLQPSETIFGRTCLERGWATRAQIADCIRSRAGEDTPLPDLLVSRNVITREQAESLRAEVSEIARTGRYAEVRKEDHSLGRLLIEAGAASSDDVCKALLVQGERAAAGGPVPRLGEILLEGGHLTLDALQEALRRQERMTRLSCPGCGARYLVEHIRPGKTYLCETCASPLSAGGSETVPAVKAPEPEEVGRSAQNPKNVLGKYVVVRELGRGGAGAVYKAWDRGIGRWVALKLLLKAGNAELLTRFRREAEMAAGLQHPNIVPIYDVGESNGFPFIVMKYVEGLTLAGRRPDPRQAAAFVAQAARAVDHAHRRDIVHRDLKPGNVMVDSLGRVYVMDFGLAKDLFGASGLTAPGTVMGTPSYMAPEQAAGKVSQVDQRSDVYSLGAILYELLAGRPPFRGERVVDTLRQVLDDPVVPPSQHCPGIPPGLEQVVLRALEKDKARRYESAEALAEALERCAAEGSAAVEAAALPPLPARPGGRLAAAWILALLVLGALAGLAALALR